MTIFETLKGKFFISQQLVPMTRGKVLLGAPEGLMLQIVEWDNGNEGPEVFCGASSVNLLEFYSDVDDWQEACDAVLKRLQKQEDMMKACKSAFSKVDKR